MASQNRTTASDRGKVIIDLPNQTVTIGTATDLETGISATVAFTAGSVTTGGPVSYFTATSTPGSVTGTASTSPITVSGLTSGTSYTFKVRAGNTTGLSTGGESAASNSITITAPGDYESIATVNVGSGGASNVEFTSIPSTYTHLQIRAISRYTGTQNSGAEVYMQFNNDTASNYSLHRLLAYANLSEAALSAAGLATQTRLQCGYTTGGTSGGTTNMFGAQVIDILDYKNTNKAKTVRTLGGYDSNTDTGYRSIGIHSGNWRSTSAITSIKIFPETDSWAQYSSFALYGIRG
jgi:hypothetical protein